MGDLEMPVDYDFLEILLSLAFFSGAEVGDIWSPKFCILNDKYYIHNKRLLDDNNIEFLHFLYVLYIGYRRQDM